MKIKNIMIMVLLGIVITLPSVSASSLEKEENYNIVYVDSLDELEVDTNMKENKLTFYVSNTAIDITLYEKNNLLQKEQDFEVDVDLHLLSKYNMNIEGKIISGEVYGTRYTSEAQLITQISKISYEYDNNIIRDSYISISKSDYLTIGEDWYELVEKKVDVSPMPFS